MNLLGRFGSDVQGGLGLYRLNQKELQTIERIENVDVINLGSPLGKTLEQELAATFPGIAFGERVQGTRYFVPEGFDYFPALNTPLLRGLYVDVHSPFDVNTNPTLRLFVLRAMDIDAPWRYLSLVLGEEEEIDYVDPLIFDMQLPDDPKISVVQTIKIGYGDHFARLKAIADVHDFESIAQTYEERRLYASQERA